MVARIARLFAEVVINPLPMNGPLPDVRKQVSMQSKAFVGHGVSGAYVVMLERGGALAC